GTFKDQQGGASVGGPVARNKAFFFGNFDLGRKNTPIGFSVSGNSGQPWNHQAEVQQIAGILKNQYGYDPGNLDEFVRPTNSDKLFVRTDFNLSNRHQLTARGNYENGLNQLTTSGVPSNTVYAMPGDFYQIQDKTLSSVGQLNTP